MKLASLSTLVLLALASLGACGDDATSGPPACTLTCTNPPASECIGSDLRSYANPGACTGTSPDFVCTYGFVDYACDNGCEAGACKGVVDPCADLVCNAPPAPRCDGDQLETFTNLGTCDGGSCSYGSVKLPCARGCENDACVGDPCADLVCNAPPSPCHAATGTCSSGVCSYAVLTGAACDDGAPCTEDDRCGSNGVCMGDAIACQSPPAPACVGNTLKVAAATGTCADGNCDYTISDVVCADGCANGACLGNPCAGVVCDTPPSPCHADIGTCHNGVCAYAFDNGASCDDGVACTDNDTCTNGACGGVVRTCTTPPAATCKDASTLIVNASAGTCADGACGYVGIDVPCAFGCVTVDGAGRCEGDPCGGVSCLTPPAATCANTTSLVVPSRTGVCSGGNCSYDNVVLANVGNRMWRVGRGCVRGVIPHLQAATRPYRPCTVQANAAEFERFPRPRSLRLWRASRGHCHRRCEPELSVLPAVGASCSSITPALQALSVDSVSLIEADGITMRKVS